MSRLRSSARWKVAACVAALQIAVVAPMFAQIQRPSRSPGFSRSAVAATEGEQALVRARAALASGNVTEAYATFGAALKVLPRSGPQHDQALQGFIESGIKLARQRLAAGRLSEAAEIARAVLRERPNYPPALALLETTRSRTFSYRDSAILGGGTPAEPSSSLAKAKRGLAAEESAVPRAPETSMPAVATAPPAAGEERRAAAAPREAVSPPPRRIMARGKSASTKTETASRAPETSPVAPAETAETTPAEVHRERAAARETVGVKQPLVKVFFATDRLPSGASGPSKYFSTEWNKTGDHLVTGFVTVSIPPVHREGRIERPFKIWTLELSEDPKKHFVLTELKVEQGDEFYGALRDEYARRAPEKRSAFVFIHGFNVTFDEAAYRTAQLAFDLDFEGVPMMYSWPSQGRLLAYDGDRETVDWSSPHLQSFLERVARESGALRIHLVAHSMGNQLLANALVGLGRQADIQPLFDNVIMVAPDVNAYTFTDQTWPAVKSAARHFTLYASSQDKALQTSKRSKGANDFQRLGEAGPRIVVISGLDTIDASGIDTSLLGHSYESCKPVMSDVQLIIQKALAPLDRKLRDRYKDGLAYWAFH